MLRAIISPLVQRRVANAHFLRRLVHSEYCNFGHIPPRLIAVCFDGAGNFDRVRANLARIVNAQELPFFVIERVAIVRIESSSAVWPWINSDISIPFLCLA